MEIQKEGQAAAAKIWKFVYGFADCLVLRCAIDLGIADIIHKQGEPLTLSELGAQIPVQPVNTDHLHRLMRYLVHMKIFTKETLDGEARYGLAPPAKFIVKGWDKSIVSIILVVTDKDFMAPWHCLKDSLCGEGTAFEKALGRSIWTYMADHPEKNKLFNEGMACDTKLLISALVQDCKDLFQGIMSLVDVGGGTGTAMRAIAKAFPHLKCTIYDLPHVIADSPDYPEVDRIAGDMFKHIPSADAILLKCILHDWDDGECIEILKRCKESVPREGGKVIIVDIVVDLESKHPLTKTRLSLDLDMMVTTGGKERTEAEWKKLLNAAGFPVFKITHISAVQSVIVAYPY
ncbi:PREDICTED: (RS)-norcoclaurine 6-O-methyltransferase-like [Nelumbo nucifera]|uniref:(RS)-norcoclaurine 6-O-methyltransferase-like n=1 Tax=Nelumbo nucifera TaxID=4432 RepID=A0A1U7YUK0_NELNU|nr:PREDICTED: (RS)-norcoclaurine 6-O-methyltransferase-like [Nelumbo nucifera]AXJ91466.1 norcoclaurine 6-O-methyltransferase 4 [Nelumbo nucifera]WEE66565.1 6-O-methyltransferase [Nelumbo nucifera]